MAMLAAAEKFSPNISLTCYQESMPSEVANRLKEITVDENRHITENNSKAIS